MRCEVSGHSRTSGQEANAGDHAGRADAEKSAKVNVLQLLFDECRFPMLSNNLTLVLQI